MPARSRSSMQLRKFLPFALVLACSPKDQATTAYVGATVLDGTGRVITNAVLIESGGHIVSLGPRDSIAIPTGATVVALDERWIIPGIIAGHAHDGESTVARYVAYGVYSAGNVDGLQVSHEVRHRKRAA